MSEVFLGVMDFQDAKNHQQKLKTEGVELTLKSNPKTCSTGGCKVTVEVWAQETDAEKIQRHFQTDYMKHVKGHEPNFVHLTSVFDTSAEEVTCQACGTRFSPTANECPDCGLCY